MKILAAILAIMVLFLAAQPVCSASSTTAGRLADACCEAGCSGDSEKDAAGNDDGQDKDCNICNPFQACACCAGFVAARQPVPLFAAMGAQHSPRQWGGQAVRLMEAALSGIWQPPRAA